MKKKFFAFTTCLATICGALVLDGCKNVKLNYPEIWYLHVSLNGGKYVEGNPYEFSENSNVMKVVSKTNFENFSMPEAKYITPPEGKVFAGWYFNNTSDDYSENWTEENWLKACENAQVEEEGKRSVTVYAKWVNAGEAVFALNGGTYGTFKDSFLSSEQVSKKIDLSDYNTFVSSLSQTDIDSALTYPVSKSFDDWYLYVAKNSMGNDVALSLDEVQKQIRDEKSAYIELFAKWNARKILYLEMDISSNLPEELKDAVRFTDEFFDTRVKGVNISYTSDVFQTNRRMLVYVYVDELSTLCDLSHVLPTEDDILIDPFFQESFDRTFDGLYFYSIDRNQELTLENLSYYVQNRSFDVDEDYLYAYLNWDQKITYDYNYETAPESTVVFAKVGDTLSAPQTPVRDGYTFVGWSTEFWEGSPLHYGWDFEEREVISDVTLYAIWLLSES